MRLSAGQRVILRASHALERVAPWHRLWRPLGLVGLLGIRIALRAHNLYDPAPPRDGAPAPAAERTAATSRCGRYGPPTRRRSSRRAPG